MCDYGLSSQQIEVISALSSGATMTAAAEQAGVHRNTVSNWRRNSLPFQQALAHAQYDRALFFREKTEDLFDVALETLRGLLADPKAPAGVRLKAALAIVQAASNPPAPRKQVELDIEKLVIKTNPAAVITSDQLGSPVHNPAQPKPSSPDEFPAPSPSQTVHNSAQSTYRREGPKIGRNDACPCGSGDKYKRCCLNKAAQSPAAAA